MAKIYSMAFTDVQPRLDVIEHEAGCPLERLIDWLDGIDIRVIRPYRGEPIPEKTVDGLIVLGGRQMSAYDDEVAPWLPDVRALLRSAVQNSAPTLGICLGAQLLAVAAGGVVDVAAAPGRESGIVDVRWRDEAADDPLMSGLPDPFPAPSLHADAVSELPAGAVWLASSAMYPYQAFRVGSSAWGVQFHPEVSATRYRVWAEGSPDVDTQTSMDQFTHRGQEISSAAQQLARRFAQLVSDG